MVIGGYISVLMMQFYKMTIESAQQDYADGLLTAKGAIAAWIRIHLKEGWRRKVSVDAVRELFTRKGKPMSRAAYYRAVADLERSGIIAVAIDRLVITRLQESQIVESSLKCENRVSDLRLESKIVDGKWPKRISSKGSESPPDSFQINDHISLSGSTQGDDLSFGTIARIFAEADNETDES